MIKIEILDIAGLMPAIYGMRNAYNSWNKSDSNWCLYTLNHCKDCPYYNVCDGDLDKYGEANYILGPNDHELALKLSKAGSDHRKYMRMIDVWVDITAPLYWWKEFDTYKVGTVSNSCSTMHTIADKEFTLDDFSCEHLVNMFEESVPYSADELYCCNGIGVLEQLIDVLNGFRTNYLQTKNKKYWWQMIQLLPTSYNQKRTIKLNYEVLTNMYHARRYHKLDEWREFCKWIETLPYSELINEYIKKEGE